MERETETTSSLSMETNLSLKLKLLISYASTRLEIDRLFERLLEHLAWSLLVYLFNFPALNLIGNKPFGALPMALVFHMPLINCTRYFNDNQNEEGKEQGRKKEEFHTHKRTKYSAYLSMALWLAIATLFHNDKSALKWKHMGDIGHLLKRLAWSLLLYLFDCPTLNLIGNEPFGALPMAIVFYAPLINCIRWFDDGRNEERSEQGKKEESHKRKRTKHGANLLNEARERLLTMALWLAITTLFHNDKSPLKWKRMCDIVAWTNNARWFLWCHILFKIAARNTAALIAVLALPTFYRVMRYTRLVMRVMCLGKPVGKFLLVEAMHWCAPKMPFVGQFLLKTASSLLELHVIGWSVTAVGNLLSQRWMGRKYFGEVPFDLRVWFDLRVALLVGMPIALSNLSKARANYNRSKRRLDGRHSSGRSTQQTEGANMELRPFEYAPIEQDDGIRLLLIHPRHDDDLIECSLFQTRLSEKLRYEAISYFWGSNDLRATIKVNGKAVKVTDNAHEVLKKLSLFLQPRLVWIDSVCIDQKNHSEKARQVGVMADIYKNACLVSVILIMTPEVESFRRDLVRLTSGTPRGDLLASLLPDEANLRSMSAWDRDSYLEGVKNVSAILAVDVAEELRQYMYMFGAASVDAEPYTNLSGQRNLYRMRCWRQFMSNPWFTRVWVVQEVALAQRVRFIYSSVEIPWTYVHDALTVLQKNPVLNGPVMESGEARGQRQLPPAGGTTLPTMHKIRAMVLDGEPRSLGTLLNLTTGFNATNSMDRLFALHGLLSERPGGLMAPTYDGSKSLEDVLLNAACFLVESGETVMMLANVGNVWNSGNPAEEYPDVNLPSWVPNWASKKLRAATLSISHPDIQYKACATTAMNARIQTKSLLLDGVWFDTIDETGLVFNYGDHEKSAQLLRRLHLLHTDAKQLVEKSSLTKDPYPWSSTMANQTDRLESLDEALWRTMIGNRTLSENPAPTSLSTSAAATDRNLAYFHANPEILDTDRDVKPEDKKRLSPMLGFSHLTMRCWAGRRVCVTRKGLIGVVPAAAREGDDIVVFGGMMTPAVLRMIPDRLDDGDGERLVNDDCQDTLYARASHKRAYVGECYIHGIMNGEAFTQGVEMQEFELV